MLPGFLLSLREGLEIALVIGIVLGALGKIQRLDLRPAAWSGALSAVAISIVSAIIMHQVGVELEGPYEPVFEGITLLLAAAVLTWMIFWMSRQSSMIKSELEAGVRRATSRSGQRGVFLMAFISVLREGIELALFLTAAALASDARQTLVGALLGLALAGFLGWSLFASSLRLDLRRFFLFTGFLLVLFAAGMVAQAVHEFIEVSWIPPVIPRVWDTNFLLQESSLPGQLLKALFGYNGNPSLMEVLAYLGYFLAIAVGLRRGAGTHTLPQKV
ncbi:MAG TPA: FTR1 family protein [Anaerolineales bacterium]